MMRATETTTHDAAILSRLVGQAEPMSPAAAEGILDLAFSPDDRERMSALAARARSGALSDDERAEVEAYSRVGSLLGVLKSKARRALKLARSNGPAQGR